MPMNIDELLRQMIQMKGSDLHVHSSVPPQVRVNSDFVPLNQPVLTGEDSKNILYSLLQESEIKKFEEVKELDKAFDWPGISARFRLNVFYHQGTVCGAIRYLPNHIPSFKELGLPEEQMISICRSKRGLVLVTGSTGAGKSTTMASIINYINHERRCHIVTVEDPVEFMHKSDKSIVTQREVGQDTRTFAQALKFVLRQDPDVILIGEMRDIETIQAALNIAETGHLVFATLHTSDCVQSINRIIDVFPSEQQSQVRAQLSFVLLSTISQQLLPRADNSGRALAVEIMVANTGIKSLIREEKIHQIFSLLQTGQKDGMRTMNQSLHELYKKGDITYQMASAFVTDVDDFRRCTKQQ